MKIDMQTYLIYLLVMAGVTLFLRAVPFILLRKKLKSVFWSSFLAYVPYTVLSAMTVPAIFFATDSRLTGACALFAAVVAFFSASVVFLAVAIFIPSRFIYTCSVSKSETGICAINKTVSQLSVYLTFDIPPFKAVFLVIIVFA